MLRHVLLCSMTKSRTTARLHCIVPIRLYERLALQSKETGVPIAEIVRRMLDANLKKAK